MPAFKVFWTHEATIDLQEIIEYISQDRISSARSFYKAIKTKCSKLVANPQKHRIVPELSDVSIRNYREIIHTPYRIIYKLTKSEIFIIAVVDCRRDFESFIFNRLIR